MTTTITGKNQVTIPADLAKAMGLEAGTKLDWAKGSEPDTIVIRIQPNIRQMLARAQELGQRLKTGPFKGRDLIEELVTERALELE